ncbi:MAG: glycoside hydrolase family 32 protein [Bacteroidota bacterium]
MKYMLLVGLSGLLFLLSCYPPQAVHNQGVSISPVNDYLESHRPQYHFSPDSMWMNDPNGMVYYAGEYHLFYQFYPDSTVWGPMHWGHAVSEDLVHWEHLPIALYPDSIGLIFSGSAVVDWDNTSGFQQGEDPPMIAIFTYHNMEGERTEQNDFQTQGIAYSNDKGRTWTKYEGNPVIPNPGIRDFRDPKVFWHGGIQRWVMIFASGDRVRLYHSPDLKAWVEVSEFGAMEGGHGGVWECPDLFPLYVNGDSTRVKWVMLVSLGSGGPNEGSGTQYFVGDFDGINFKNDHPAEDVLWLDYGKDNYAGVTYSDILKEDNRRIFMGWMSNWQYATLVPTHPWRSAMTVPRTLELKETSEGLRLFTRPVDELASLRGPAKEFAADEVTDRLDLTSQVGSPQTSELILTMEWEDGHEGKIGLTLANGLNEHLDIGYDIAKQQLFINRIEAGKKDFSNQFAGMHVAPLVLENELALRIFIDWSSVEVFAEEGKVVMTETVFPNENFSSIAVFSEGGILSGIKGRAYGLKRIWGGATMNGGGESE